MDFYDDINYGYNKELYKYDEEEKSQKLCQKRKQEQTEAEALELTYSHLGRLLQSAEMLAFKLNLIKNGSQLKYQYYDSFDVAEKKEIDTLKYDVINFLDFYEKAIIIHNKKFNYVLPESIHKAIKDLNQWASKASKNDKRFFTTILDLIQKGSYDYTAFPDENILYEKAKKDNSKFKKDGGFWKTFSIPILKFLNSLIHDTREKVKANPKYKPDLHFGLKANNNKCLVETLEIRKSELKINEAINDINLNLLDFLNKKGNSHILVEPVKNLNELYSNFKKKYPNEELEINNNHLNTLKTLIEELKSDPKLYNILKNITIEMDPNNVL